MKLPKPFFRKSKQAWYVQLGPRQLSLGKDRELAFRRYQQLLLHERGQAAGPALPADLTVAQLCEFFLDWSQRHNGADTYCWYQRYLQGFCDRCGGLRAAEVKPFHVTRWLDGHQGWGDGSRRAAVTAVKRAFNWAEAEGLLPANPVKRVPKPPARSRDRALTAAERREVLAAIKDQHFRDFVVALQETGCRPSEAARVEAANVDLERGLWVLPRVYADT
jgi:integrase